MSAGRKTAPSNSSKRRAPAWGTALLSHVPCDMCRPGGQCVESTPTLDMLADREAQRSSAHQDCIIDMARCSALHWAAPCSVMGDGCARNQVCQVRRSRMHLVGARCRTELHQLGDQELGAADGMEC